MRNNSSKLGNDRMQQLREAVAAKQARQHLIESLGDNELDWVGYDTVEDILEYLDWAVQNNKDSDWVQKFGSKQALVEHIQSHK